MVLAKLYTDRVRDEAHGKGREEGRQEMLAQWQDWNARRQQAERAGQPFTEPEPGSDIDIVDARK